MVKLAWKEERRLKDNLIKVRDDIKVRKFITFDQVISRKRSSSQDRKEFSATFKAGETMHDVLC